MLKGTSLYHKKTAYFSIGMVDPEHRGLGVFTALSSRRMREVTGKKISAIFVRTQNPHVETRLVESLKEAKRRGWIKAYKLHARKLLKGVYGQPITAEIPRSKNARVQERYNKLSYEQGDAYLLSYDISY